MKRPLSLIVVGFLNGLLLSAGMPSFTWADGFRNPFQDTAAIAQGNAFRAQADNPSAIHYNPAGMTQLPRLQHSFGVQFVSPNVNFRSPTGITVENRIEGGVVGLPPPGQFFITANLKDLDVHVAGDLSIGLGLESLYGFANEYPKDGPFATAVTKAQLPLLDIKPTAAYKISDFLSIGLGADIFTFASFIGEGQSEQQFIAPPNIPGVAAGDMLELNGTGTTAGLNASVLITPLRTASGKPRINLGFIWRSQAVLPLKGHLLANGTKVADARTSIRFPESYEWGLAGWLLRDERHEWKIEVDVDLVRWSSIRNFDVSLSNGVFIPNPQNWSNAVTVGVGTEFTWLHPTIHPAWEYALRAGYLYSETPIPDANFNPAYPDSDVNGLSVGLGFFCQGNGHFFWLIPCGGGVEEALWPRALGLDLAYFVLLWEPRTVTGNPNPGINGTYTGTTQSGSLTFRVNF